MHRILAGVETEYGLFIAGRGAENQIEDSMAVVRSYPNDRCFLGWNYRHESPRADLRGFVREKLEVDPEDARFDVGRTHPQDHEVRSDRVLPNGARLYNDHGHPEYATPECWTLAELAAHDHAGEGVVLAAARAYAEREGKEVRVYKNNTDFHGASYGTHESYLVPRRLVFADLMAAVLPMLVARQVLTGSGKVGSESGKACAYQISQRADFFTEVASVDTLYRRPIFNTRDEPHADPAKWQRLHVISGDANMIASATARKAGLVKLALELALIEEAPRWRIADPVEAFRRISRDETVEFRVELEGGSWTTAREVIESYLAAAERQLDLDSEAVSLVAECRELLEALGGDFSRFARSVDWAAKRQLLEQVMDEEGLDWRDPALRSYDLEYHNVDPDEGLAAALKEMGLADPDPDPPGPPTSRARARGLAASRFGASLRSVGWRTLVFEVEGNPVEVDLDPEREYGEDLDGIQDLASFIAAIRA
ncbi:MAG: proteasome accessory factor PafA2 family protein [Fimbriimonadales bacterium]